jgi:uncharacterized tellurite resistance protein B-like protein
MDNVEIINSVVSMLVTDGKLHPQESEFLKQLCQRLGVSNEVVEQAFEDFVQGESYVHLPESDAEKQELIAYLLEAMVADGQVAPEERELLEAVAVRLGVSQHHFEDMLNILIKRTTAGSNSDGLQ